ncbi:MAG: hypothetical protein ACLR3U_04020, partial [Christensenellaceae bacterium]
LISAAKVKALMNGRFNVSYNDVNELAYSVLRHRMKLNFEAIAERVSPDEIISKIIGELGKGERVAPVENVPLPEAALAADTPDMSEEEKSEGKKKRGLFGRK